MKAAFRPSSAKSHEARQDCLLFLLCSAVCIATRKVLEGRQKSQCLKQHIVYFCMSGIIRGDPRMSLIPVTLGSCKLVHCLCQNYSKGQLHQYQCYYSTGKHSLRYPYRACECNLLQTQYPVSQESVIDKNGLTPAQLSAWSQQCV